MRLVGVAHHLGGAAGERGAEHGLAQGGAGGAGTEVVRSASDRDLDPAGLVRGHQLGCHRSPGGGLRRRGPGGQGLDEVAAIGGPVRVQVVEDHEAGSGGRGAGEHPTLEGRELFGPAGVVHRVEAEVDHVRTRGDGGREGGVGGVATDEGGAGQVAFTASVDGDDVDVAGTQLFDDVTADLAGAEDDVSGHDRFSVLAARLSR